MGELAYANVFFVVASVTLVIFTVSWLSIVGYIVRLLRGGERVASFINLFLRRWKILKTKK